MMKIQKTEIFHINQNSSLKSIQSSKNSKLTQYENSVSFGENTNFIKSYAQMLINRAKPIAQIQLSNTQNVPWKNNLKSRFENNQASVYALVMRTFNAQDKDGDELIDESKGEVAGTFRNAVERLDEIKNLGINTLHVLPINPVGKLAAKGTAGCVYSVKDFLSFEETLGTKDDFKYFVDECHKRGICVMVDLPSCASTEFFKARPDLMAIDARGLPEVPQGWEDIRMFAPYSNKDTKTLNKALLDYHKQFIDLMLECKVDGLRTDVARAKPVEFWDEIISYARSKDPQFGFLGETYTYEDASPMLNMPYDRPNEILEVGFDTIYGQYHLFPDWDKANDLHKYVIECLDMSHNLPKGKSFIGSFATHDDKSPMSHGGAKYCNLTTGLQYTLPMMNPYFISGFETGDTYIYPYKDKFSQSTRTDSHTHFAHPEMLDIFNLSRKPGGKHSEIAEFMIKMAKVKEKYSDVITKGTYIPLKDTGNKDDSIIAFARHYNGKTLLVVANRDVNFTQSGNIKVPGLSENQVLNDLAEQKGDSLIPKKEALKVKLAPAAFHVFEINTPYIERQAKEVFAQKL